jgi:hypothetical protein
MFSVVTIGLLAFVAHAEEQASDPIADLMAMVNETDSDKFTDMLADQLVNKLSDHLLATSSAMSDHGLDVSGALPQSDLGAMHQDDVASALNALGVDAQNAQDLLQDYQRLEQYELNRAAEKGTAYEWIKYNSEVDPQMAFEAKAAVALMNQRAAAKAGHGTYDAPFSSQQEEELAQTSSDNFSLSAVLLMACFAGLVLTFAKRYFNASTENKEYILLQ